MAGNLGGGLEVGFGRGILDRFFLGRAARVDINRHQRLGNTDHDIPARFKLHRRVEHCRQVVFNVEARENRQRIAVAFHVFGVRRHQHFHVILGLAVAALAVDNHLVDLFVIKIADRAFDQRAFLVDRGRGDGFKGKGADIFPLAAQIFIIALDLGLGALRTGGANNQPRALGHRHGIRDLFQLFAVSHIGDFARNAATARGVGHQHAIPTGQRQIG